MNGEGEARIVTCNGMDTFAPCSLVQALCEYVGSGKGSVIGIYIHAFTCPQVIH